MKPKVSVIGAGNVGAEVARRLAEKELSDVTLVDILEGIPQGKALDMLQSGPLAGFSSRITGSNHFADIENSEIVVVAAGLARKPGLSRDDLLQKNAEIICSLAENIKKFAPNSIILTVTNPLDTMTYLAWKVSGFPFQRVLGMAPLLDTARMAAFIAQELGVPATEVKTMVLGTHGDLMVPIISKTTVSEKPILELLPEKKINEIIKRAQNSGAEIVALFKTGSAYYAPSAAAAYMAEAIIKDKREIIPSCVYSNGEYGIKDLYIGLPARLGRNGAEEIIELELTKAELLALHQSAGAIKENNTKCEKLLPKK